MYKLPNFEVSITDAQEYANASISYTYDYQGWEDQKGTNKKYNRILIGRFGQEWLYNFCKLNNLNVEKDRSSYKENDKYDLMISGKLVDVKTSISELFIGQISPGCYKNELIDIYCFILTDEQISFIEPIGFISRGKFIENCYYVPHNGLIRGKIENRFLEGSYFIDRNNIYDFYGGIKLLKGI